MEFEYIKQYYGVPAAIGRRVTVNGRQGIIVEDCGHHLGVNFDEDKPMHVERCHPTWKIAYGEMGEIRKLTRSQQRYKRFLEYGDGFDSFIDYCRWDSAQSWD